MKIIAINVDWQNDFCEGSLGVGKDKFLPVAEKIKEYFIKNKPEKIIFTQDFHPANHSSFKENGGIWPVHCVENTFGAEIEKTVADFVKLNNLKPEYFLKGRDAQKEEYGADIQNLNADENTEIHVFGLCYDYCVKSTADIMKQRYPKAKVKILKSLTVAINPDWVYQGDCIVIE